MSCTINLNGMKQPDEENKLPSVMQLSVAFANKGVAFRLSDQKYYYLDFDILPPRYKELLAHNMDLNKCLIIDLSQQFPALQEQQFLFLKSILYYYTVYRNWSHSKESNARNYFAHYIRSLVIPTKDFLTLLKVMDYICIEKLYLESILMRLIKNDKDQEIDWEHGGYSSTIVGLATKWRFLLQGKRDPDLDTSFTSPGCSLRELCTYRGTDLFYVQEQKLSLNNCFLNSIDSLPDDLLSQNISLSAIKSLYLEGNLLSSLPLNTLKFLPELKQISIRNNYLKHWPQDLFTRCKMLEYIDFSDNKLETIDEGVIGGCTLLRYLFLHNNALKKVPPLLLNKCRLLREFTLGCNQLEEISDDFFEENLGLKFISLAHNKLTKLPDFSEQKDLTYLSIYGNAHAVSELSRNLPDQVIKAIGFACNN